MRRALLALLLMIALPAWAAEPRDLSWQEMIPPDAPVEVPNMTPLHDLSNMADALSAEAAPAARQDLPNAPVVATLNDQHIRLPGYIVPLEVSEEGRTTEFLLVPYFGACIHTPPPPANQIIHAVSAKPRGKMRSMEAFWVSGTLEIHRAETAWGAAGYRLRVEQIERYEPDVKAP